VLIASSDSRRRALSTALVLLVLTGCAQPVDAPAVAKSNEAASVADLQATAERIAAELPRRSEVLAHPAPPFPRDAHAPERQLSPAEWTRLEEVARRELPALVAQTEKLAARR
jgi:hypothetical protein